MLGSIPNSYYRFDTGYGAVASRLTRCAEALSRQQPDAEADAEMLGISLAEKLMAQGAGDILAALGGYRKS